jgi:pimeloyl-ACP methyl ester carboxylesterase
MHVELVNVQTEDGVRLDGSFRAPSQAESAPRFGLDLVICHHGVGGKFYGASFFDDMADALLAGGTAVLRVNNRGHDQAFHAGPRRLGAAYELIEDCRHDMRAWLDFAERRGFQRIALWGHSLGAVKTVYFVATHGDPRVTCAIASSPPRFSYQAYLSGPNGARFKADIDRAEQLIQLGKPEELVEALIPQARPFSARTYINKYGPIARFDYFEHLPNVRVPLLLTLGGLETPDVSFAPLAENGPGMSTRWPHIAYHLIDGADHFYAQHTADLWSAVSNWLQRTLAPVGSMA